jgi:hypothetical protein
VLHHFIGYFQLLSSTAVPAGQLYQLRILRGRSSNALKGDRPSSAALNRNIMHEMLDRCDLVRKALSMNREKTLRTRKPRRMIITYSIYKQRHIWMDMMLACSAVAARGRSMITSRLPSIISVRITEGRLMRE